MTLEIGGIRWGREHAAIVGAGGGAVKFSGGVEAGGVGRRLGVLAGELLHQGAELGGAGVDLHGVGYVDNLNGVRLFLGFGFFGGCSLLHAVASRH